MKIILNDFGATTGFTRALRELTEDADTLSVAVSYIQVGGWEMLKECARRLSLLRMRIICTDQFGFTHPAAVERALEQRVQVRKFVGTTTYHPKVYLAHQRDGRAIRFLIGSANLSTQAFSSSVEAGLLGEDRATLNILSQWFDDLFERKSERFTPELLEEMAVKWRLAAAERARTRLLVRRKLEIPQRAQQVPVEAEDVDTLEDILATIQLPIGLLNLDYAGNNIRNINKVREVLSDPAEASGKQKSELKLLGFMLNGKLTGLGREASAAATNSEIARHWCRWLKRTAPEQLGEINQKLLVARRVFPQFWRLKESVREYFLANAQTPEDRQLLQTIELLCNARDVVQELSLDDMRTLSGLLHSPRVPDYIREDVTEYFDNKGQRSWDTDDRRVVPLAWRDAEEG